jgi:hypothetical protein
MTPALTLEDELTPVMSDGSDYRLSQTPNVTVQLKLIPNYLLDYAYSEPVAYKVAGPRPEYFHT